MHDNDRVGDHRHDIFGLAPESSSVSILAEDDLPSPVAPVIVVGFSSGIDRREPEPWTTKFAMFLWAGAYDAVGDDYEYGAESEILPQINRLKRRTKTNQDSPA